MDSIVRIASVTGVDVELKIAGPGGRSYAFVVDWHIRFLIAAAWFLVAGVLYTGQLWGMVEAAGDGPSFTFVVLVPAAAIYLLYHPIVELVLRGQTPGKRIAGVRLVAIADGGAPGSGAILIRNVFRLIDSLPFMYVIGLLCVIATRHAVRIGDIAGGTVLVYDEAPSSALLDQVGGSAVQRVGLAQAQLVHELLGRWRELAPAARVTLATRMLAKHGVATSDGDDAETLRAKLRELVA